MSESCINPFSDFIIKEAIAFEPGKVYMINIKSDENFHKDHYSREQVVAFAKSLKEAFDSYNINVIINMSFFNSLEIETTEVKEIK